MCPSDNTAAASVEVISVNTKMSQLSVPSSHSGASEPVDMSSLKLDKDTCFPSISWLTGGDHFFIVCLSVHMSDCHSEMCRSA